MSKRDTGAVCIAHCRQGRVTVDQRYDRQVYDMKRFTLVVF